MNKLSILGGLIILAAHIPLFISLYKRQTRLSLATWLLWSIIDTAALVVSIAAGAIAPTMVLAFTIAAWIVFFLVLRTGNWIWKINETISAVVALVSLVLWFSLGSIWALASLVFGKYIAVAVPTYIDAYARPEKFQFYVWGAFAVGALLNIVGLYSVTGSWNVTNFLYPTVGLLGNGLIAVLHFNLQNKKPRAN